jgi:hypothetical protein
MPCTTETTSSPPLNLATQSGVVISIERHEFVVVGAIFVVIAYSVEIAQTPVVTVKYACLKQILRFASLFCEQKDRGKNETVKKVTGAI